jgi:hypothetical protein
MVPWSADRSQPRRSPGRTITDREDVFLEAQRQVSWRPRGPPRREGRERGERRERRDLSATGTYRWAVQGEARTPAQHGRVGSAVGVAASSAHQWASGYKSSGYKEMGMIASGVSVQIAVGGWGRGACALPWLLGGTSWDELPSCRRARAVSSPRPLPCLASCTPACVRINGHCTAQCG